MFVAKAGIVNRKNLQRIGDSLECDPKGIRVVQVRDGHLRLFLLVLYPHPFAGFLAPSVHGVLPLDEVHGNRNTTVDSER